MITRTSLANEIDEYDQQIADMNSGKKDCFDAYRDQLLASGMAKPNIKGEIDAVKAAIKRRRLAKKDPIAVEEKDALVDEIFEEITTAPRAPRATRENIEEFDPKTGEILGREERRRQLMSEDMDSHKALIDEMAGLGMISEEARAENKALADAVAGKFGNGPITPSDAAPRQDTTVVPPTDDSAGKAAGIASSLPENSQTDAATSRPGKPQPETENRSDEEASETEASGEVQDESAIHLPTNQPETATEMDRATDGSFETGSEAAENDRKAIPARGPTSLEGGAVTHAEAGEIPATISGLRYEAVPPFPVKVSAYAHFFPEYRPLHLVDLADDIAKNGVVDPIVRHGDVILDGWARYDAARHLGIEYPVVDYDGDDALIDVIKWQRSSRDYTPQQETKIARAIAKAFPDRSDDIWTAFHQAPGEDGLGVAI